MKPGVYGWALIGLLWIFAIFYWKSTRHTDILSEKTEQQTFQDKVESTLQGRERQPAIVSEDISPKQSEVAEEETSSQWRQLEDTSEETVPAGRPPMVAGEVASPEISAPMTARDRLRLWDQVDMPFIGDDAPTEGDRYLIARCDSGTMFRCGGWNNRLNGALFAYVMANITGRRFRFEHLRPDCDFTNYLVPNKVNWHLKKSFHKNVDNSETVKAKLITDQLWVVGHAVVANYSEFLGAENIDTPFVYFLGNIFYELGFRCSRVHSEAIRWMKNLTPGEVRAALYKRLFKLSVPLRQRLENIIKENLPSEKHKLVCAHLRIGRNPTNPLDSEVRGNVTDLGKMWDFLKQQSEESYTKVFVASDSNFVVQTARNQTFGEKMLVMDGPIIHVDRATRMQKKEECAGMERLMLDLHLMMACDVLVVSHSGFSHHAAHVRGTDQGLYCWMKSGEVIPCKRKDIYRVFFEKNYHKWTYDNCSDIQG